MFTSFLGGFSNNGSTLMEIRSITLSEEVVMLRRWIGHYWTDGCKMEILNVYNVKQFNLTICDVGILQIIRAMFGQDKPEIQC